MCALVPDRISAVVPPHWLNQELEAITIQFVYISACQQLSYTVHGLISYHFFAVARM